MGITAIPKIRTDYAFPHAYTHSLYEMNGWIRTFNEKVRLMAVQRDIAVPNEVSEQINLYKLYLEHHSQGDNSENEEDQCPTLDSLDDERKENEENNDNDDDDDDDEWTENDENKEEDEEKEIVVLTKEDKLKKK